MLAYVTQRKVLLGESITNTLSNYTSSGSDYCSTLRSSCKILIQLTHDENRLYQCFFTNKSSVFRYDKKKKQILYLIVFYILFFVFKRIFGSSLYAFI